MSKSTPSREALWYLLNEAAEIEHNLMCCYLYAVFSLREPGYPSLTAEEDAAIQRWRRVIMSVAIEEMSHLANVCNILSALGAPAHFLRPNFPAPRGYHPAGIVVRLAPFSLETLDHFIFLERPESVSMADGDGFAADVDYRRDMSPDRLTPAARDYEPLGSSTGKSCRGWKPSPKLWARKLSSSATKRIKSPPKWPPFPMSLR